MLMILFLYASTISSGIAQRNPASTTRSGLCSRTQSRSASLKAALDAYDFGETTVAGIPRLRARSSAKAPSLLDRTSAISVSLMIP